MPEVVKDLGNYIVTFTCSLWAANSVPSRSEINKYDKNISRNIKVLRLIEAERITSWGALGSMGYRVLDSPGARFHSPTASCEYPRGPGSSI